MIFFNRYFIDDSNPGDINYYWDQAEQIASNPSFIITSPDFGLIEPLHNIIIGFIRMLPGNDRLNLAIIQIIIFAGILMLLYDFSLKFGSEFFAFLVIFWTLTSYRFYLLVWNPNRDIWIFYFVTLMFYFAYRYCQIKDYKNLAFFSIFSGLVLLTDMRYLAHIGLVWLFFMLVSDINLREKIKRNVLVLVLMGVVIFPWIYRQYKVHGEWMFISKYRSELFAKVFDKKKYQHTDHYRTENLTLEKSKEKLMKRIGKGTLDKNVYDRFIEKEQYYNENKFIGTIAKALEFWKFFSFDYSMMPLSGKRVIRDPWSLQHNMDGILHIGILIPFFFMGIFYAFKNKKMFLIMLTIMLFGHTLMHALTYVQERYRLIIIPYYFILSFYGFFNILNNFLNRLRKSR